MFMCTLLRERMFMNNSQSIMNCLRRSVNLVETFFATYHIFNVACSGYNIQKSHVSSESKNYLISKIFCCNKLVLTLHRNLLPAWSYRKSVLCTYVIFPSILYICANSYQYLVSCLLEYGRPGGYYYFIICL